MTDLTLREDPRFPRPTGPVCLVILDGVGLGPADAGNAWHLARTPVLDALMDGPVTGSLRAHGRAVGMPSDADMGNSEVGHNALGAGRIFEQGASLVQAALGSGEAFTGQAWRELVASPTRTLHLVGLWSDGNVHSHLDHAYRLIAQALADGLSRVRLHLLLDGRDVGETSALDYVGPLESRIAAWRAEGHDVAVASGGGRMVVTMDRYDADWRIVERGWRAHVHGEGRLFTSASAAIAAARAEQPGIGDQNLPPFVVASPDDPSRPAGPMADGDAVVLFNFRGDRAIQLTRAFETPADAPFPPFDRGRVPAVRFAGMTQYDGDLGLPRRFLVSPPRFTGTLGERLAAAGLRQLAVSETQKYGHVTYFFNGNRPEAFAPDHERYIEIPSDRVDFATRPWMKAAEVVDATLEALDAFAPAFVRVNLANGDMVGHTGRLLPAILAMEAVDLALGRLLEGVAQRGGLAVVLADHGNCEEMYERDPKTGAFRVGADGALRPRTSHTTNPVPLAITGPGAGTAWELDPTVERPGLANIAATCLNLLGFEAPADYAPSVLRPRLRS
jgi:2,3-bisphosphoglycerate-independent phosphoglycerate mutase